ncbi:MAG: hypothetical protein AAFZ80_13385 [Cyanobacteria bacterium P01_A01_bin.105]
MPLVKAPLPSPVLILLSRQHYTTTRIQLTDEPKPVPAIQVGATAYSFFRTVPSAEAAMPLMEKLCDRSYPLALTKIPKGYAIWIEESTIQLNFAPTPANLATCHFLKSGQYRVVKLRLPKLDLPVTGVQFNQRYYSIFCKETNLTQLIELAGQLADWGNPSLVLRKERMLCIQEPQATLA